VVDPRVRYVTDFGDVVPIFYAANVERAVRFYREAFGFEVAHRWPPEGAAEYAFLRRESLGIGVAAFPARDKGRPPRYELCVHADDADRASDHLVSLGALQLLPPGDQPWAERVAYFADPEGNPIRLTAPVG
jgi:lactoylglutathione lyase